MSHETLLLLIILLSGLYMAWNIGANDVANAVGTSVGSGALTLKQAVCIAALLEFCGAFFFGSYVTDTIQSGIVDPMIFADNPQIFIYGMLSALIAAGLWLQIASYFGWPVSTTHSIVGAIVGFGAVVGGMEAVYWENVGMIALGWIFSPLFSGILGYVIFNFLRKRIFYAPCPIVAAKKYTPFIILVFVTTLAFIIMLRGLKGVDLELSSVMTLLLALGIGLLAGLAGWFFVKQIKTPAVQKKEASLHSPDAITALDKAYKHLTRARKETSGEMEYEVSVVLDEVKKLAALSKQKEVVESSDYAAVEKLFGRLQIMSACSMAFAHGANDVANSIGPLAAAATTLTTGLVILQGTGIPTWALVLGGVGIIFGLATWGWRVIETIGRKLTELTPSRGFSAEFGAALTIVFATSLGLPISTTHTLVGAVVGVGIARGIGALNLNTTRDVFISWVVTVPAGAGIAISCFYLLEYTLGY